MAKRLFDVVFAAIILVATAPITLTAMFFVWLEDRRSPLYLAPRVGQHDRDFTMIKIRSMRIGADRGNVSTSAGDTRITAVGRAIRRFKLDELSQFWNVLVGTMSVVGPRPTTRRGGADLYTDEERRLLTAKPGITDLSSIVFSDEGDILAGAADPELEYNRVIRPWKSRLGLLYIDNRSFWLDVRLVWLTALAVPWKSRALAGVDAILGELGADPELREVCRRRGPLPAGSPPGLAAVA